MVVDNDTDSNMETGGEEIYATSPGRTLQDWREEAGLNRAHIGKELGLTETAVRNLEQDRFDHLPGLVYARGYVKNYAKVLGQSEKEIAELFDSHCSDYSLEAISVKSRFNSSSSNPKKALFLSVVIVIGLIIVVINLSNLN